MKVMCINDYDPVNKRRNIHIRFGEVYEAVSEAIFEGTDCYELADKPSTARSDKAFYAKYKFIPISEIDETTFERSYNTQTV